MKTLLGIFLVTIVSLCACKKEATEISGNDSMINGKWSHIKNIDWYTFIPTGNTLRDTTDETQDVYIDFRSGGLLYQKAWSEATSAYIYDTASFSVIGNTLTITSSNLTLTDPYKVEILTASTNKLNFHTIDTVGYYRVENWDFFVKQ